MRAISSVLLFVGATLAMPRTSRIIGGELANIGEFPFMANMQYETDLFAFQTCGGSLITNRAVVSAAHCFVDQPSRYSVILGTNRRAYSGNDGVRYLVSKIIFHPKWNTVTKQNDVVIFHLSELVTYTNLIQRARIAGPNFNLPDGNSATFAGWGDTSYGGSSSEQLMKVNVNIINQSLCAQRYAELKLNPQFRFMPDITDDMMCSGILDVGGKDACQGDSGGPLVYDGDVVVGIISWGHQCADAYYPGVVSRVSYNSEWIENNA